MKGKITFLTKALTMLIVALFSMTARAGQELDVYFDEVNTTSQYVPVYTSGFYQSRPRAASYFTKSQFIIPAEKLSQMNGATVSAIRFFTGTTTTYQTPTCKVYVQEISSTDFGTSATNVSFKTVDDTPVYEGELVNNQYNNNLGYMNISFDTPYIYGGSNLLVSIENTATTTTNGSLSFYGYEATSGNYTAVYGRNQNSSSLTSGTAVRFIPSTVFYYDFPSPTDLTASHINNKGATISWTGIDNASSYNLRHMKGFYESFDNGMDGWTVYTEGESIEGLTGWFLYDGMAVAYSWDGFYTGEALDADNWLITPKVELGGTLEFDVLTSSSYPDSYAVLLSTTGREISDFTTTLKAMDEATSGLVSIDLSAYAGQTGYIAIHHVSNDCYYLDIDNFCIRKSEWTTVPNATSPYVIEGLDSESLYGVQVQAVYAGGTSDYAGISFSTTDENPIPAEVVVDPIASQTATISWYGISDSYDVKYRKISFFDNFENGLDKWTIETQGDHLDGSLGWILRNGMAVAYSWHSNYNNGSTSNPHAMNADNWLISPAVELGGTLEFDVLTASAYPDSYAVLLSTNGYATTDFTTTLRAMATATSGHVSIDLSAYAGQTGYIAIHHVSNDCYYLDIDNFAIHPASTNVDGWNTVHTTGTSVNLTGLVPDTSYEFSIIGIKKDTANEGTPVAFFTTLPGDFTVTVPSAGYTTFVAPFNISELPEGLEAYACQANNSIAVHLEPVTAIPEGEAVVLKKTGTYILTPASGSVELGADNDLLPSDGTIRGASNIYALANKSMGVGFYPVENTVTIPAGKGYLVISSGEAKPFYGFFEDDATAIGNLNANVNANETIYNVAGQRINKMQKGINIINGKKILK